MANEPRRQISFLSNNGGLTKRKQKPKIRVTKFVPQSLKQPYLEVLTGVREEDDKLVILACFRDPHVLKLKRG